MPIVFLELCRLSRSRPQAPAALVPVLGLLPRHVVGGGSPSGLLARACVSRQRLAKFNPDQKRGDDGKWAGSSVSGARDALALAKRITLMDGETFIASESGKTEPGADSYGMPMALINTPEGPRLLLGEELNGDATRWDPGVESLATLNPGQMREFRDGLDTLASTWASEQEQARAAGRAYEAAGIAEREKVTRRPATAAEFIETGRGTIYEYSYEPPLNPAEHAIDAEYGRYVGSSLDDPAASGILTEGVGWALRGIDGDDYGQERLFAHMFIGRAEGGSPQFASQESLRAYRARIDAMLALAEAAGDAGGLKAGLSAVGSDRGLRTYWTKGEGAVKIGWGTPGDFARCVTHLSEHVADPEGLCAEYHHAATGEWPGRKHHKGQVDARFNPDQPRDSEGKFAETPGVSSPNAIKGVDVLDAEKYESLYGDVVDDAGIALGDEDDSPTLLARYFDNGDAHVSLHLEDGKVQVFEEMDPESMRQLAYDLEEVLAVDETEFVGGDPYGIVADADSHVHGFYVAKDGVGDIHIRPPDTEDDDYFEVSAEQAQEFADALLNMADGYEEYFDGVGDEVQPQNRGVRVGAKYNPDQLRDGEGKFAETPGMGVLDKLKLGSRIDLRPGESLVASQKIPSAPADWHMPAAVIDGPAGRELRLGIVFPDDVGRWSASDRGGTVRMPIGNATAMAQQLRQLHALGERRREQLLEAEDDNDDTIAEGIIPAGPWGDLHYYMSGDADGDAGWTLDLRRRPPDAPLGWVPDYGYEGDTYVTFGPGHVVTLAKLLDRFAGLEGSGVSNRVFNHPGHPDQSVHGRKKKKLDLPGVPDVPKVESEKKPVRKRAAPKAPAKGKPDTHAIPVYAPPKSVSAEDQRRATRLVRADPQLFATVHERMGSVSGSGNLNAEDSAWLQSLFDREPAYVNHLAQAAQIDRNYRDAARKVGKTPAALKKEVAAELKDILAGKPVAVRVRDEAALQDILSGGRFKTSFDPGVRRAAHLGTDLEARRLGEQILGIDPDTPPELRPIYGYVALNGIEPALSEGKKIPGLGQREGQEDLLSTYGKIQVVLKPELRARTTASVGDSLDEMAWIRPSPLDNPEAGSVTPNRLRWMKEEADWTRTGYVEAQMHGGVGSGDIAEVVFPAEPGDSTASALAKAGIPWRVLTPAATSERGRQ